LMNRRNVVLALAALALFPLGGRARAQEHKVDVVYGHKLGCALTMDVFTPAKPNGIGVIWMVSGGWVSNHNSINPAWAKLMTDRGLTVFQVVHGSQPKFTIPEIVEDIHRSVRFIRTHASEYSVDPNKLGICGASAGGHLSLMIGAFGGPGKPDAKDLVDRASSAVQAIATLFPPTDFLNWGKAEAVPLDVKQMAPFRPAFGVPASATPEQQREIFKKVSPYYGVTEKMPPTLLIHGDKDGLVPIQQSEHLLALLKEKNVPCRLDVKPGKNHGWPGIESELVVMAEWFEKYLK
jgi:acetyl esterase/lipase